MEVEGAVLLDTFYEWHKYSLQFYVVDHPATQPILGLKSCEQLNLIYRVDEMCESQITEESIYSTNTKMYFPQQTIPPRYFQQCQR